MSDRFTRIRRGWLYVGRDGFALVTLQGGAYVIRWWRVGLCSLQEQERHYSRYENAAKDVARELVN